MVGAGVDVRLHAGGERGLVAPRHHLVDEAVAQGLDVVVGEAETLPVVRVVREGGVDRQGLAGDRPGGVGVGVEDDTLLDPRRASGPMVSRAMAACSGVTR